MIKSLFSASLFLLFSLLALPSSLAAAPQATDFPYERQVLVPQLPTSSRAGISLNRDFLNSINEDFSNINLFNEKNEEVPFEVYYDEFARLKQENLRVLDVSSQKDSLTTTLIDGDPFTTYTFDERIDGRDDSWFLLDLGRPYSLVRLKIFKPDRSQVRYVQIQGGLSPDKLKTVVSKRAFDWQLDFNSDEVRYLKISLWGIGVKVDDIKIYKGESADLYFNTKPEESYRLLYGGGVDLIRYTKRLSEPKTPVFWADLTKKIDNPLFPEDWDGDGYNNDNDNCPFVSNPLQRDGDGDRVGNDCDNALDVKNSNQYDTDYDGVGDVIDNCKLIPNPDQADRDGDGYGDECDSAHAEEVTPEGMLIKILLAGGIAVLIILGIALWKTELWKKLPKIKK